LDQSFSHLDSDLLTLPVKSAWLDGEIVALRPRWRQRFQHSAERVSKATAQLAYPVFDLLYLDGYDLRQCALADRKRLLAMILEGSATRVQYVEHVEGRGALPRVGDYGRWAVPFRFFAALPNSPVRRRRVTTVRSRRLELRDHK
jgi:hypothetical protein